MYEQQKKLMWSSLKVGVVLTVALVTLFVAVFFFGALGDIFVSKTTIYARVDNVSGLRSGAPVWVMGVEVGTVGEIKLLPKATLVTLSIRERVLELLHRGSMARILSMGLLGDKYVEISTIEGGNGDISPGDTLPGMSVPGMEDIVQTTTDAIVEVERFMTELDTVFRYMVEGEGTLVSLMRDPTLYNNLNQAAEYFAQLGEKLENGNGTLPRLINDPALYAQLRQTSQNLSRFSETLTDTTGTLYRLARDQSVYQNLQGASQQLASLLDLASNGSVAGVLLDDEAAAEDIRETLERINLLLEDVQKNPKRYFNFELF
jgi:phospholipid/cholesterol/gamma-HCH transport system substrate-binding protein